MATKPAVADRVSLAVAATIRHLKQQAAELDNAGRDANQDSLSFLSEASMGVDSKLEGIRKEHSREEIREATSSAITTTIGDLETIAEAYEMWERAKAQTDEELPEQHHFVFPDEAADRQLAQFETSKKECGELDEKTSLQAKLLCMVYLNTGRREMACQLLEKRSEVFFQTGDYLEALSWVFAAGKLCETADNAEQAIKYYERGFDIIKAKLSRYLGDPLLPDQPRFGKRLANLYISQGRTQDALSFASDCFASAQHNFHGIPHIWADYRRYLLYKLWARTLGQIYCATNQIYMARHLWQTMVDDLKEIDWKMPGGRELNFRKYEVMDWGQMIEELGPDNADSDGEDTNVD